MLHIVLCYQGSYVRQRLPSPVQTRALFKLRTDCLPAPPLAESHLRHVWKLNAMSLCRYCRGCIEPAVLNPAGHNVCPACAREGAETFLGRNPFAMQRLQPDFSVDAIVRKLLPPDVRWHLDRMQCKVQRLQSPTCRALSASSYGTLAHELVHVGLHLVSRLCRQLGCPGSRAFPAASAHNIMSMCLCSLRLAPDRTN
jgi:hypothetical protein